MKDPVYTGLQQLTEQVRPYVLSRANTVRPTGMQLTEQDFPDAQSILVFMWDHWNDIFRHELTYVERCLVSELREYRNRWAHQQPMGEHDVFRFLDNVHRLIGAVLQTEHTGEIDRLRKASLRRLYDQECRSVSDSSGRTVFWPMVMCLSCAFSIDFALLYYFLSPISGFLAFFVVVLMFRLGQKLTANETAQLDGPRACGHCDRIIYSRECPYCQAERAQARAVRISAS